MYRASGSPVADPPAVAEPEAPAAAPPPPSPPVPPVPVFEPRRQSPWPAVGFLLLFAAVLLLAPALWPTPGQEWRKMKIQGETLYAQGDVHGAERLYRQALAETDKRGPRGWESAMVLHDLAQDLEAQGRGESAEHAMEKSLAAYRLDHRAGPKEIYEALTSLGTLYLRHGKHTEAVPVFREALALGKTLPAHDSRGAYADMADLAVACQGAHHPREADALFRKAIAAAPTNIARDHILRAMKRDH